MKKPELIHHYDRAHLLIGLPPGWKGETHDLQPLCSTPRRKIAKVVLTDADSYVGYMQRHGSADHATLWCLANFLEGTLG